MVYSLRFAVNRQLGSIRLHYKEGEADMFSLDPRRVAAFRNEDELRERFRQLGIPEQLANSPNTVWDVLVNTYQMHMLGFPGFDLADVMVECETFCYQPANEAEVQIWNVAKDGSGRAWFQPLTDIDIAGRRTLFAIGKAEYPRAKRLTDSTYVNIDLMTEPWRPGSAPDLHSLREH